MLYRYETHIHGSQCSLCASSTAQEMALALHKAGFSGMVLTDHFIWGNTSVDRKLPWEERMRCYYRAFQETKDAMGELDFDVIFGLEHAYGDGKELLVYGIDLDFLLSNPDIPQLGVDDFVARVHGYGGIVIQAHPYRDRWYVNMAVGPRGDLVDGIEVYNACNYPEENLQALELSEQKDYIITSGGDLHIANDSRMGMAGVAFPYRVRDSKALAQALKRKDHCPIIKGQAVKTVTKAHLR